MSERLTREINTPELYVGEGIIGADRIEFASVDGTSGIIFSDRVIFDDIKQRQFVLQEYESIANGVIEKMNIGETPEERARETLRYIWRATRRHYRAYSNSLKHLCDEQDT